MGDVWIRRPGRVGCGEEGEWETKGEGDKIIKYKQEEECAPLHRSTESDGDRPEREHGEA